MFQKAILALTAAAALTSATMTFSTPAEAHIYFHEWHHHRYWHHPHLFVNTIVAPEGECYWVSRPVKVWTSGGPVWVHRRFNVCE